jgi:hypothetical protein
MEKNSKKIEKVQERAFRFVYEDYNSSYDNLLKKAKALNFVNAQGYGDMMATIYS